MTLSKREAVEKLAEALQSSQSFADIYDIFLTHFAESDDWKTPGKKINKPLLRKMLVRLASTKFSVGKDYDYVALHDKKNNLIHGMLNFSIYMGAFFYLPSIDKGMLCISKLTGGSDFFRFTLQYIGASRDEILACENATEIDITSNSSKTVH